jgi:hypothetical protein
MHRLQVLLYQGEPQTPFLPSVRASDRDLPTLLVGNTITRLIFVDSRDV